MLVKVVLAGMLLVFGLSCFSQDTITLRVQGMPGNVPLPGATALLQESENSYIADSAGTITIPSLRQGKHTVHVSSVGYAEKSIIVSVPPGTSAITIMLERSEEEEEEVVVTATRLSRTIANIPTRVEVISGEELAEKANMRPGEIRMLLSESTGIQVQQTSATSFNAGIRIQGLDGRYTQVLRDGYPLYSGFSGGLSIMQTAPLDLRQVEVIKGSASTLYGGGAIAGLVNLVSKIPWEQRELSLIANGTSAGGLDLSGFYSERYGKAGVTLFASRNSNRPFDPAKIGLTAIPQFERYTLNPRLFLYGPKTTADAGVTYITENRIGGSVDYIKNGGSGFFEKNNTKRITTQAGIAHKVSERSILQLKNSFSYFDRLISVPGYSFEGVQRSSFTELTWNRKAARADWVIGTNFLTDDLQERTLSTDVPRNYHYNTYGIFVQNALTVSDRIVLESGLRGDFVQDFGFELLPRISAMFRVSPELVTRIGGGFGYKTPTIFTEETERVQFRNLLPIDLNTSRNERSIGANWDINYRTMVGELGVSFNHLFFYTKLNHPLVLTSRPDGRIQLQNADGHVDTRGTETNVRLVYGDFKLFVGYTFTDANTHFANEKQWLPLTAKHRLNNVLMWEKEDSWKVGLEAYYFSRQRLNDGSMGKAYWIAGFMVEKVWERLSLFVNFENFTDTRQTGFDTIYTGSLNNPQFRDIYAPVEGFVVNGGVKLRI